MATVETSPSVSYTPAIQRQLEGEHEQARPGIQRSSEKDKKEAARKRWSLGATINGNDSLFVAREATFRRLLADPVISLAMILTKHFTPHEKKLFEPADPQSEPVLHQVQKQNRERYEALLGSDRFRGKVPDLPVKLTMLYFGLPVAPSKFNDRDAAKANLSAIDEEVLLLDNVDPRVDPTTQLRFLNSYDERSWGKDRLRNKGPKREFESLYIIPGTTVWPFDQTTSLRGGGFVKAEDDEQDSDDDMDDVDSLPNNPDIALRGGMTSRPQTSGSVTDEEMVQLLQELDDYVDSDTYSPPPAQLPTVAQPTAPTRAAGKVPEQDPFRPLHPNPWGREQVAASDQQQAETSTTTGLRPSPSERMTLGQRKRLPLSTRPSQHPEDYTEPQPPRSQDPISNLERGRRLREYSYNYPLSVHTPGDVERIPINAPPIDTILRPQGEQLPAVVPLMLAPSEQRKLQSEFFGLRNVSLKRTQKCPYEGCGLFFPIADKGRMQDHLKSKHMSKACNLCDEPLFEHWSAEKRRKHTLNNHGHTLGLLGSKHTEKSGSSTTAPVRTADPSTEKLTQKLQKMVTENNALRAETASLKEQLEKRQDTTVIHDILPQPTDGEAFQRAVDKEIERRADLERKKQLEKKNAHIKRRVAESLAYKKDRAAEWARHQEEQKKTAQKPAAKDASKNKGTVRTTKVGDFPKTADIQASQRAVPRQGGNQSSVLEEPDDFELISEDEGSLWNEVASGDNEAAEAGTAAFQTTKGKRKRTRHVIRGEHDPTYHPPRPGSPEEDSDPEAVIVEPDDQLPVEEEEEEEDDVGSKTSARPQAKGKSGIGKRTGQGEEPAPKKPRTEPSLESRGSTPASQGNKMAKTPAGRVRGKTTPPRSASPMVTRLASRMAAAQEGSEAEKSASTTKE